MRNKQISVIIREIVGKYKFPNIYRTITKHRDFFMLFPSVMLLITVVVAGIQLYKTLDLRQEAYAKRAKIVGEIAFWQKVVDKYAGYRDGYLKLALLEYQLGDKEKSKFYLDKTLALDPNFEKGRILEQLLK